MSTKILKNRIFNIFLAALTTTSVLGCSNSAGNFAGQPMMYNQNPALNNNINAYAASSTLVTFNNAYKTTTNENEAIGRRSSRNPDKYMKKLIDSARSTIDGAFYDIEDMDMIQAFINAHKRGVRVRIVTDTDNIVDKDDSSKPREAIIALKKAGIPVVEDNRSGIMHQKFMIVDNATVWTGSMNLTTSSIYHHNNNSIRIQSKQMAENYTTEFKRLFEEKMFGPNSHAIPYPVVKTGDATFRVYFSPKGGTGNAVEAELQKAKESIVFMTFSLTDKAIRDIILNKKNAGVKVYGIMDKCMTSNSYSLYRPFRENKIYPFTDGNQALLHHKVFIIDGKTVITGSYNYSQNAEKSNNENTLIIDSPSIAKSYMGELDRLVNAAKNNKNIPPYDHPACGGRR